MGRNCHLFFASLDHTVRFSRNRSMFSGLLKEMFHRWTYGLMYLWGTMYCGSGGEDNERLAMMVCMISHMWQSFIWEAELIFSFSVGVFDPNVTLNKLKYPLVGLKIVVACEA
ncbi:uncharacterized protein [Rutidosis leptorrhynchoides]|uniref:uncharacterized protein n=1 Tax=Rutidosis leptorrhynchoides TaxID=125765 RepID=UPI003A996655